MATNFRRISKREEEDLVKSSFDVREEEERLETARPGQKTIKRKKLIEVPYTETVQVPVHTKVHTKGVEEKTVTGVELVPVKKVKEVKETGIEYKEEVVRSVKEVWVKKEVPYEKVIRKPVTVVRTKQVPYTDYEEKRVEMKVHVPCDKVELKTGYREDKVTKTRLVEVEQDLHLHHGPVVVREGTPRMREIPGGRKHGVTARGKEVFRDDERRFLTGADGPSYKDDMHLQRLSSLTAGPETVGRRVRSYSAGPTRRPVPLRYEELMPSAPSTPNHGSRRPVQVRLQKPDGHAFGIHFDASDGETIKVTQVKPGHFMDRFNEANPHRQIKEGDRIVEVNGVRGNAKKLMDACLKTQGPLDITLARK